MFLLIIGLSISADPTKICVNSGSTKCQDYDATPVTKSDFTDASIKDGYSLYFDAALSISFEAFSKLSSVNGIEAAKDLTVTVTGKQTASKAIVLNYTNVKVSAPSEEGNKLLTDPTNVITFADVTLNGTGSGIAGTAATDGFVITKVTTNDITLLTVALLGALDETGASIYLTIQDLDTLKWADSKTTVGTTSTTIEIPDAKKISAFITSEVTAADKTLTVTATTGPSAKTVALVDITIRKKEGASAASLKLVKSGEPVVTNLNWILRVRMNTELNDFPVTKPIWDDESKKFLIADGVRLELPETGKKYCIAETSIPEGKCSDGIVLLSANEIKLAVKSGVKDLITFSLFGFGTNAIEVNIKDVSEIDFSFVSDPETPSLLKLTVDAENVGAKTQKFSGIKLNLVLSKDTFAFGNLVLSSVTVPSAPSKQLASTGESAKKTVTSKKLTTDILSLSGLVGSLTVSASDAFTLSEPDLKSLEITASGIKVTDSGSKTITIDDSIFKNDPTLEIGGTPTFTYEKPTEGEVKTKSLNIVMTKSDLKPTLSGDGWGDITINLETNSESGKFEAKTNDGVTLPKFNKTGDGTALMNGEEIARSDIFPTTKGGLSGGAIAGIVIACVVVVAAVVVVVVVVIKKKKGKVAN